MGYYWYNFMPLSRGSAAVGTVAVQGLMLAAGFDVAAPIPPGVQPDWEAGPRRAPILYPRPHCAPILYPAHTRRILLLILATRALAVCSCTFHSRRQGRLVSLTLSPS